MLKVVRAYAGKLDRHLREQLVSLYHPFRWIPCFMHGFLENIFKRVKKFSVIIEFNDKDLLQSCVMDVENITNKHMRCKMKHTFASIGCCSADLTAKAIEDMLVNCSHIKKIHMDREVKALLDVASPSVHAEIVNETGLEGNGVTIAVLDTGVHPHPDLLEPENRLVAFKDFVNDREEPYDDNGHGTHCAGDALGNGFASNGQYKGPAPKANLVAVRVLNKLGSGSLSTIIAGVQWCIDHKETFGIDIISMSLGSTAAGSAENDPMVQIVEEAWNQGIVVCVAAGNSGPDEGRIASPGISPKVITVGAMDDKNTVERSDDEVADFSSRGPTVDGVTKPDILAPGVSIVSWRSPKSFLDKLSKAERRGERYLAMSGTSMATPICAGVCALIIEANPGISPDRVKEILLETAEDWGLEENVQGKGYINARRAVLG